MKNLHDKKIIILAHVLTTVPAEDLKEYFIAHKVKQLLYIALPLFFKEGRPGPYYELYKDGKLSEKISFSNKKLPSLVQYIRDFFLAIYWIIKQRQHWDLIVALDNLNTSAGLFVRSLGFVDKVIYYTIDFTPKRFANSLLNAIYHAIEKYAVLHADITWILTERVAEGREKLLGIAKNAKKQSIVPIGIWTKRIKIKPFSEINKHTIVYAGGLVPHQGVQLVLEALPLVLKTIPNVQFTIIGMGDYEQTLMDIAKKLKITKQVNFLGYLEKHTDVENILSSCGLAVAMYSKDLDLWSYYADPSKIKSYLASGLPVITTSVTHISEELKKATCGIVVPYQKEELAHAIIDILSHPRKHEVFRNNAREFSHRFDWDEVFGKGLSYV